MKTTSAVIFPDTVPATQLLTSLVLVFEPVVYCQAVENDDSGKPLDAICQEMLDLSYCNLHIPAPLEEDRERFLHLVRGLKNNRDDYAAQLTHVSLAGISSGSQPGTESQSSILSSLLAGHGIKSSNQELKDKLLWQARLVLKLGEQYDVEQQKVDEEMRTIHEREQKMFSGVSSGESMFHLTEKLATPVADTNRMQRLRLKAWSRMFCFGPNTLVDPKVFVTADPDAVDRLLEEYERSAGSRPDAFVSLQLPAYPIDDNYFEKLQQFKQDKASLLGSLSDLLEATSSFTKEELDAWNTTLEKYFPSSEYGRCRLTLYQLTGIMVKKLFLDSFGHDEENLESEVADETHQDIVLGLLAEH